MSFLAMMDRLNKRGGWEGGSAAPAHLHKMGGTASPSASTDFSYCQHGDEPILVMSCNHGSGGLGEANPTPICKQNAGVLPWRIGIGIKGHCPIISVAV